MLLQRLDFFFAIVSELNLRSSLITLDLRLHLSRPCAPLQTWVLLQALFQAGNVASPAGGGGVVMTPGHQSPAEPLLPV